MFSMRSQSPVRTLIKGIIITAAGVFIVLVPNVSLNTIVQFIGALLILDGLSYLVPTLFRKEEQTAGFFIIPPGITTILIGVLFLLLPVIIVKVFVFILGITLLLIGSTQLTLLLKGQKMSGFTLVLGLLALLSTIAGIVMLFNPFKSAVTIVMAVGGATALYGLIQIFMSFKIKRATKQEPKQLPHTIDAEYEEVE
jgi:uncharacterized membrane protein HdeD (DUF308 family)